MCCTLYSKPTTWALSLCGAKRSASTFWSSALSRASTSAIFYVFVYSTVQLRLPLGFAEHRRKGSGMGRLLLGRTFRLDLDVYVVLHKYVSQKGKATKKRKIMCQCRLGTNPHGLIWIVTVWCMSVSCVSTHRKRWIIKMLVDRICQCRCDATSGGKVTTNRS